MDTTAIQYLVLANGFLVLFTSFYLLFLRRETYFQLNRLYLLGTLVLSFLIPLVHAAWSSELSITQRIDQTINLPEVVINGNAPKAGGHLSGWEIAAYIYIGGVAM